MAIVSITTMGSMWCDCGDMFGRTGWPMPPDILKRIMEKRCPTCDTIYHGPILQALTDRPLTGV